MEAMYAVFAFAFLCCLGLLAPVLSVARVALLTLMLGPSMRKNDSWNIAMYAPMASLMFSFVAGPASSIAWSKSPS